MDLELPENSVVVLVRLGMKPDGIIHNVKEREILLSSYSVFFIYVVEQTIQSYQWVILLFPERPIT